MWRWPAKTGAGGSIRRIELFAMSVFRSGESCPAGKVTETLVPRLFESISKCPFGGRGQERVKKLSLRVKLQCVNYRHD